METVQLVSIKFMVFGPGGTNGWVHVGLLEALEREFVDRRRSLPRQIEGAAGASVGSLMAVAMALSFGGHELRAFLTRMTDKYKAMVKTPNVLQLFTTKGLYPTDVLDELTGDLLEHRYGVAARDLTLLDMHRLTGKQCHIAAHNLSRAVGELLTHETEPDLLVRKAVCMSCALPGVFEPVEHGGSLYVDAAVSNELPLEAFPMQHVLAVYLADNLPRTTRSAASMSALEFFTRVSCSFGLLTKQKLRALPEEHRDRVLTVRVPSTLTTALSGFASITDDDRDRLLQLGEAVIAIMLHYKEAVLSQAASLYLRSLRWRRSEQR